MERVKGQIKDFFLALIMFFLILIVSERLYVTGWAPGLGTIPILSSIAVILGMTLGVSRFTLRAVFWIALGYSIPFVILILGSSISDAPLGLDSILSLVYRLENSLLLFLTGQPVKDTALFITFVSLGFWIISLTSGFALIRKGNFSGAVLPAGVVLVIIQLYDSFVGKYDFFLAIYFFLCLLLLGRLTYAKNRLYWQEQRVAYLEETGSEMNVVLLITTFVLVILSWTAPSWGRTFESAKKFWTSITRPLQNLQEDLGQAVAGIQGGGTRVVISFGEALSLGEQASTGDSVYLRIITPRYLNQSRYYWHVRSYNVYSEGRWYTQGNLAQTLSSDSSPISLPDISNQTTANFSFTTQDVELSNFVTPQYPVWVNMPSSLVYIPAGGSFVDPIVFHPESPVSIGDRYVVEAYSFEPTITQLRNASGPYPEWVMENYMQLPADLPNEITQLALSISAHYESVYDIASSITNYLRSQITYSTTVDPAPEGTDPMVWFLFDSKTGFCNYYASAEVILLRSIGIPARLSVGFAQGEFEPPNVYTVRQSDSHAWPEVYFQGIGWIAFEPTTAQPQLSRPLGEIVSPVQERTTPNLKPTLEGYQGLTPPGNEPGIAVSSDNGQLAPYLVRVISFGIIVGFVVLVTILISPLGVFDTILVRPRRYFQKKIPVLLATIFGKLSITIPGWLDRWMYYSNLDPIEKSFTTIYRSLKRLKVKYAPSLTPAQAAVLLAEQLPEAAPQIQILVFEHQRSVYGPESGNTSRAGSAERKIRFLTFKITFQKFWNGSAKVH